MPGRRRNTGPAPAEPDPLAAFLASIDRPLGFLTQSSDEVAARAHFPGRELAARGRAIAGSLQDTVRSGVLDELCTALEACGAAPPETRRSAAMQCVTLAIRLRGEGEGAAYHRRADAVDDDLESLRQSVQFVPGVGPRRAELLRKFGIVSIEDLLYHLPFRYEDRRELKTIRELRVGEPASVQGELTHLEERHVGRMRRRILEGVLRDDTGFLALTWFNQVAYFKGRFEKGARLVVHGKVEGAPGGQKRIVHPDAVSLGELEGQGVLPIYSKPTTLNAAAMRKIAAAAVDGWAERVPSVLPPEATVDRKLADLAQALAALHKPNRKADVDALNACRSVAHNSLVFDELFFLQLGLAVRRRNVEGQAGFAMEPTGRLSEPLRAALPFRLTVAQERVLKEIGADMAGGHPMHRLVQGDVGSGKTVVAALAAASVIENGYQAALMAPTELLAEQHHGTIGQMLQPLGIQTALLTGARGKGRKQKLDQVKAGEVAFVVGTHAVIQDQVEFAKLGLGIVDEQHRFGVLQRARLRSMGSRQEGAPPHMLLMTATPIPRTLAMSVYGDLDMSVLDQLPPGRKPIRTLLYAESRRAAVYEGIKREIDRGRQAYVVYPLVEESEVMPLRNATSMAEELARAVFHGYRVGLLHGKMKPVEKDAVMRSFKAGELQVLVSTTVIEVGIDVPNATVMVIEHADRFGLSQLHQLRGRVGRGEEQSTCVLIAPFRQGDDAHRRLTAMVETNDGFRIADVDLEIRGPGELMGTRQAGMPDFRVANLLRDRHLLEEARRAADAWLERDPQLKGKGSEGVRKILEHRWAGRLGLADVG